MRIGIFSDTHANIEALEAVLKALDDEAVDQRVCLGDTVGYGASPNECCALIRVARRAHHPRQPRRRRRRAGWTTRTTTTPPATRWTCTPGCSTPENMEWLKTLPYEVREGDVHFCHGSPLNIEEFDYIFARDQAAQCLEIWDDLAPLTLIGHSHLCKSFALSPDGVHEVVADKFELRPGWKYIVSVGSVGQPRDYDPRASYVLYDTETRSCSSSSASSTTSRPRPRRSSARTSSRTSATASSSASDVAPATSRRVAAWSRWPLRSWRSRVAARRAPRGAARAAPASRTIRCRRPPATPAGSARPR